jgi:small subunit ribosomal protein S8
MENTKKTVTNYPVGDFLIRLKNASMAGNKEVSVSTSNKVLAIAEALKKFGFLDSVKNEKGIITVSLTFRHKRPLILNIKLISKPGLRIYLGADEIEDKKGPSIYVISSPKGIISSLEAVKTRVGGEIIAEIF